MGHFCLCPGMHLAFLQGNPCHKRFLLQIKCMIINSLINFQQFCVVFPACVQKKPTTSRQSTAAPVSPPMARLPKHQSPSTECWRNSPRTSTTVHAACSPAPNQAPTCSRSPWDQTREPSRVSTCSWWKEMSRWSDCTSTRMGRLERLRRAASLMWGWGNRFGSRWSTERSEATGDAHRRHSMELLFAILRNCKTMTQINWDEHDERTALSEKGFHIRHIKNLETKTQRNWDERIRKKGSIFCSHEVSSLVLNKTIPTKVL